MTELLHWEIGRGCAREMPFVLRGMLRQLRNWIAGLDPVATGPSVREQYADTHTCPGDGEDKICRFVTEFVGVTRPKILWNLGCNTGAIFKLDASAGSKRVIEFDLDQQALKTSCDRACEKGLPLLPLCLGVPNPSPKRGRRQKERQGLAGRASADAVPGLAFEHHLTIGRNIPLSQFVDWFTALALHGVVEYVDKSDPTVQRTLAPREDISLGYEAAAFETALSKRAGLVKTLRLSTGGRRICWYATDNARL